MAKAKSEYSGAVRAVRVEIKMRPGDKEQWKRLLSTSDLCRELTNCAWQTWLVEHVKRGTAAKIRTFLNEKKAWHDGGQVGNAPKWEGFAMDATLSKLIYRTCVDTFPSITPGSISAFLQIFNKRLSSRKASNGSLPGWWAILLCRESIPSSTRAQPIPVRAQETTLANSGANWTLTIKANRHGFGKVLADNLELLAGGYKTRSVTAILERILSGDHKLCGSQLTYDRHRNKWFAMIGYQKREKVAQALSDGMAFLRPGLRKPWRLRIGGKSVTRGGNGEYVGHVRNTLLTQRWSRQSSYRFAGSANKGHGRERATAGVEKLSLRWKDFVKTANQQLAAQIVKDCLFRNVGKLVYFQPTGTRRDSRLLATVGKVPGRHDSTGWDWYQVKTCLASECEEFGITFVVRAAGSDEKGGSRSQSKAGKGLQPKRRKAGLAGAK